MNQMLDSLLATMGIYRSRKEDNVYALLAEFADPGILYTAVKEVRAAGYKHFDAHTPFPIHGLDHAMGLGNSKVGYFTIGGGLTGLALAVWLQWFTGGVDYPLNISGKPYFALEPSIPVAFEVTILLSALTAVAAMLALNGLPRPYSPLFYSKNFARVTDDAFFIQIGASDKKFDLAETTAFLQSIGALNVETIYDNGEADD